MAGDERFLDALTEDEAAALNEPEPKADEQGPTPLEETVENKEPSPPEPEKDERKEPEEEPKPEKKPEEEPKKEEPPIDGILTKDGKHFMPFGVLEQERAKRQEIEARAKQLEAENEALKKPKAEQEPTPKAEPFDIKAKAKKLAARAYESEDGMAEALEEMFQLGTQAASTAAQGTVTRGTFASEVSKIKSENSWLENKVNKAGMTAEDLVTITANTMIAADPNIDVNDVPSLVRITQDAVNEVKAMLRLDQKPFDRDAETKRIREEVTKEVLQKFNINPKKVTTLSDVRNLNPEALTRLQAIEQLEGVDFEEAFSKLKPAEQDEFMRRRAT